MFNNNRMDENNLYDPVFTPRPHKKHTGLKKVGKAVLGLALVACVSVGSVMGYNALFPAQAAEPSSGTRPVRRSTCPPTARTR